MLHLPSSDELALASIVALYLGVAGYCFWKLYLKGVRRDAR